MHDVGKDNNQIALTPNIWTFDAELSDWFSLVIEDSYKTLEYRECHNQPWISSINDNSTVM